MAKSKLAPGEGQGMLFDAPTPAPTVEVEDFTYIRNDGVDAPATSLSDYYQMLHAVVVEVGEARSKGIGFAKLHEESRPVREFAQRMETTDNDQVQRLVVKSSDRNRFKAQDILNRHNQTEYERIVRYAKETGAYTLEFVQQQMPLPPSIDEIEYKYFTDPSKNPRDLQNLRRRLAYRAKKYSQTTPGGQVA